MNIRLEELEDKVKKAVDFTNTYFGDNVLGYCEIDSEDEDNLKGYIEGFKIEYLLTVRDETFNFEVWENHSVYLSTSYYNGQDEFYLGALGPKGSLLFMENISRSIIKYIEFHKSIYEK